MILNNTGRAIHSLYRWLSLAEQVTTPTVAETIQPDFLGAIQNTAQRLATTLQGIHGIENGIKIATQLSTSNPRELVQGCSDLKNSLQGPDFGLALAIAPNLQPDLEKELSRQSRKFRQLIEGGRITIPTSTRQIAQVASLIGEGPVPLTEILKVMYARRRLLNQGACRLICSGGVLNYFGSRVKGVQELFSGRLERSPLNFKFWHREGGSQSVALGHLYHAFLSMRNSLNYFPSDEMPEDMKGELERFFNFLDHPFLQLAFVSYIGNDNIRDFVEGTAFQPGYFLEDRLERWSWVVKRPMIEIATYR